MGLLRERKTVNVFGAIGVKEMLAEERGEVSRRAWSVCSRTQPAGRAESNRDVEGSEGVAKGGGEDVGSVPGMRPGTTVSDVTSLGHKRKKTTPWRRADRVFAPGVPRRPFSVSTQLQMKTATLWKTKTNLAGGYVNIGVRFSKHLKAKSTIAMKLSFGMFRRLLTTYVGNLAETNVMNPWTQKKNLLQVLMGFHTA